MFEKIFENYISFMNCECLYVLNFIATKNLKLVYCLFFIRKKPFPFPWESDKIIRLKLNLKSIFKFKKPNK